MSTADDWSRIRQVFSRALDLDPSQRSSFVREACGSDTALHAEVTSLLAAHADAGSIAEGSPLEALDPSAVVSLGRGLRAGDRLGPYEIVGLLGSGGMGEVYEARDTALARRVAIKILSPELALDASARERFSREAKALATLNHPNIGGIYGLETTPGAGEESQAATALVLELVEGQTLAERLARGRLSVADALPVAAQIAGALEAAHERGVIHRDLKPANIKITPNGTVKVLDFGLAKVVLARNEGADRKLSLTHPGMVLGTPAYLSPEQVRGVDVDRRADIWAFGCVLFELLTGRQTFAGATSSDCLAAVLDRPPDWTALPQATPDSLRALLRRCLQKDSAKRLRDIGDARFTLEDLSSTPDQPVAAFSGKRLWRPAAVVALSGAALVAAAIWANVRLAETGSSSLIRFEIEPPPPDVLNVSTTTPTLAMSPDGQRLAYQAGAAFEGGPSPLAVRDLAELMPRRVDGAPAVRDPFFSPDGQWIGYYDQQGIKKVSASGGSAVAVVDFRTSEASNGRHPIVVRGASWATDRTIVYGTGGPAAGLSRVSDDGGTPAVLTIPDVEKGEAAHVFPNVLPAGRGILFTILDAAANSPKVAVLDSRNGSQKILIPGAASAQYSQDGHLVYAASGTLFAVAFDVDRLQLAGSPVTLANGVMMGTAGGAYFAVSQTGSVAYVPASSARTASPRALVWVHRNGTETPLTAPPRAYGDVSLSPDESKVAVDIADEDQDVWTWDLRRETATRITTDPHVDRQPLWSSDGKRLIFSSNRDGAYNLYTQSSDGNGPSERLTSGGHWFVPTSITSDGAYLLGHQSQTPPWRLFVVPFGSRTAAEISSRLSEEITPNNTAAALPGRYPVASPNARYVAYSSSESGQDEIYVRRFPDLSAGPRWKVSSAGGSHPGWSRNGRELFFLDAAGKLTAAPVDTTGTVFHYDRPVQIPSTSYFRGSGPRPYDISRDGTRFVMIKENPTARPAGGRIVVILNAWQGR